MAKHLVRDLEILQKQILAMAGFVEDAIYQSMQAVLDHNRHLAEAVIDGDDKVDEYDNGVIDECLKLIALHQPVAGDLRRIATVFMLTTDLERMGDLAVDIAKRAIVLASPPIIPIPEKLSNMTDLVTSLVRQSLDAFVNLDARLARKVIRLDNEVDHYNDQIIDKLLQDMKKCPDHIDPCLSLFSIVRHLERIGDHATNIAEDVIYLVDGEMVRHRTERPIEDE